MQSFKSLVRLILLCLALLGLPSTKAGAATYNIDNGELKGAYGVSVNSGLYDVSFMDGTCVALYTGCDDVSDFTFNTADLAFTATLALLEQVFNKADYWDLIPDGTAGINPGAVAGQIITPFAPHVNGLAWAHIAINRQALEVDVPLCFDTAPCLISIDSDTVDVRTETYAKWTPVSPVPAPAAIWLFGTALIGYVGMARRRKVG